MEVQRDGAAVVPPYVQKIIILRTLAGGIFSRMLPTFPLGGIFSETGSEARSTKNNLAGSSSSPVQEKNNLLQVRNLVNI
jgi:hypothetical protein